MRVIAPEMLQPGMVVASSVFQPESGSPLPLIGSGVVMTPRLRNRLLGASVRSILIDDRFSIGILPEQAITDSARRDATSAIRNVFSEVMALEGAVAADARDTLPTLQPRHIQQVGSAMGDIVVDLLAYRGLVIGLSDLERFGGDRLQRAVNMSVLGVTLGRRYLELWGWRDFKGNLRRDQFDARVVRLGVGLMLADIGMTGLPMHLLDVDPAKLSQEDLELVHQHPISGLRMVRDAFHNTSSLTSVTIVQHHERADGSGYPKGLVNEQLHDHGLIAGVADAYISMTGAGASADANCVAPHEAYQAILSGRGTLYDEKVISAFEDTVDPYSPGATVRLTDGSHAIVTGHSRRPMRPLVRITHGPDGQPLDTFRELALGGELQIAEATRGLPGDSAPLA